MYIRIAQLYRLRDDVGLGCEERKGEIYIGIVVYYLNDIWTFFSHKKMLSIKKMGIY